MLRKEILTAVNCSSSHQDIVKTKIILSSCDFTNFVRAIKNNLVTKKKGKRPQEKRKGQGKRPQENVAVDF